MALRFLTAFNVSGLNKECNLSNVMLRDRNIPGYLQRWAWIYGTPSQHRFRSEDQPKLLRRHEPSSPRRQYLQRHQIWLLNEFQDTQINQNLRVPWVLLTKVLPICRTANMDGALTSYQSLRVKGSMLKKRRKNDLATSHESTEWHVAGNIHWNHKHPSSKHPDISHRGTLSICKYFTVKITYIFFFKPFFPPFESPLFLPTAMVNLCRRDFPSKRNWFTVGRGK